MKKLFLLFAVILTIVVGIGYAPPTVLAAENIIVRDGIEVMPARTNNMATENSVCWQAVYDAGRNVLRQQIFPVNGADKSAITQEMRDSLATIKPKISSAYEWQAFGFTCKPAGWRGFVDYNSGGEIKEVAAAAPTATTKSATKATTTLPKVKQPVDNAAKIAALQKKLDDAKAEAKRLADAKAAAAEAKAKKASKAAKPAAETYVTHKEFDPVKDKVGELDKAMNGKGEDGDEVSLVEKVEHYWTRSFIEYTTSNGKAEFSAPSLQVLNSWFDGKMAGSKYVTKADLDAVKATCSKTNIWPWLMGGLAIIMSLIAILRSKK